MAAKEVTTTSRRALLVGAASLPALAIAGPAAASADAELLCLCEKGQQAWQSITASCEQLELAGRAIKAWERRNPKPEWDRQNGRCVNSKVRVMSPVEREALQALDPGVYERSMHAQGHTLIEEYGERSRAWRLRKEMAERQASLTNAKARERTANEDFDEVKEAVCDFRATTMEGFRAKARLSLLTETGTTPEIAFSLARDVAEA